MQLTASILAAALLVQPGQPAETDLRDEVRTLVRRLGASELSVRDDAEKRLLEIGVPALTHIPEPNKRMKAEMRQRVRRIRDAFKQFK